MSKTPHAIESLTDLMSIFNGFFGPSHDSLWWRTTQEYAPMTLLVNCNDLFYWATADAEEIWPEDIPDLRQAVEDITQDGYYKNADLLWVCRKRKQRPQVAYYKYFDDYEKPLFDACGTAEDQYGNPAFMKKLEIKSDV